MAQPIVTEKKVSPLKENLVDDISVELSAALARALPASRAHRVAAALRKEDLTTIDSILLLPLIHQKELLSVTGLSIEELQRLTDACTAIARRREMEGAPAAPMAEKDSAQHNVSTPWRCIKVRCPAWIRRLRAGLRLGCCSLGSRQAARLEDSQQSRAEGGSFKEKMIPSVSEGDSGW